MAVIESGRFNIFLLRVRKGAKQSLCLSGFRITKLKVVRVIKTVKCGASY